MHLRDTLAGLEREYGTPWRARARALFDPREFGLLEYCARKRRSHDVTLFIRGEDGRFAVIRKPSYAPGVYRPPSGGVEPGEPFEAGAAREGREETGLEITLERFLVRVEARFILSTDRSRAADWTTLIFLARAKAGHPERLCPQDRVEICDARWAEADELRGPLRAAMLEMGTAGMRYRVDLQDLALAALGEGSWWSEPGRVLEPEEEPEMLGGPGRSIG